MAFGLFFACNLYPIYNTFLLFAVCDVQQSSLQLASNNFLMLLSTILRHTFSLLNLYFVYTVSTHIS